MPLVSVAGLTKTYPNADHPAVKDVALDVAPGEVVALLGPSGCGKTTTLRCVAGLEPCDAGAIVLADRSITSAGRHLVPPEKREMGMVFQSYSIWPHMTVSQNIRLGLRAKGMPRKLAERRIHDALSVVDMVEYADSPATNLSGGQQQRVALARSLALEPKVLLFDEPLSNLDAGLRVRMRADLRNLLVRLGIAALYVTHDQAEAFVIADRIMVMKSGVVVQEGTARAIYTEPATPFVAEFIGAANVFTGPVESSQVHTGSMRLTDGQSVVFVAPQRWRPSASEDAMICVRPHAIRILPEGAEPSLGPGSVLRARVSQGFYLGDSWEYRVAIGDLELKIAANPEVELSKGTRVRLWIPLEAAFLLPHGRPSAAFGENQSEE